MRISGTGPSPLMHSNIKEFKKLKSHASKVPKQAEAEREMYMLSKRCKSTEVNHKQSEAKRDYNFNTF